MNLKYLLFFILLLSTLNNNLFANTGKVKRALKALEKEKFEKVEKLLIKSLEKDSLNAGAHYVFSLLFTTDSYENYNIDSAYDHINISIAHYNSLKEEDKTLQKLRKVGIADSILKEQKTLVEALAFKHVSETHTIAAYNYFLQHYSTAVEEPEARRIRNKLAFEAARKINTYDAYKNFIDTYPDAVQIKEASELYEFLLYENKTKSRTLESYVKFLKEYPNTNYSPDALENIFELYTISNKPTAYLKFNKDYPGNAFSKKAIDYLYHIIKDSKGIGFFVDHYSHFIDDSLRRIIQLDKATLFPVYANGLYGFKDNLGNQAIPPKYNAIEEDYLCGALPENYLLVHDKNAKQIVTRHGKKIFPYDYNGLTPFADGLLLVNKKGRYGLLHVAGYQVAESVYDTLTLLNRQYIKYQKDEKWGLLSYTGRKITAPEYDDIFMEGGFTLFERRGKLAIANDQKLFSIANQEQARMQFIYDEVILLDPNTILGVDGKEQVVLNSALQVIVPKLEQVVYRPEEGWLIRQNGKFRFYSEEMIPLSNSGYDAAYYQGNWLSLKKGDKWALLDQRENTFPDFKYDSLTLIGDYFALGKNADTTFLIFQDMQKKQLTKSESFKILRPMLSKGDSSIEYLLVNNKNNYKTVYNQLGKPVITGQYTEVDLLGPYLFTLEKYGKKGLADTTGSILLTTSYDGIGNYSEGYATTLKNQKFGLYNPFREVEIKPEYDVTLKVYSDSVFIASKNKLLGLINKDNKVLLPFQFDQINYWSDSLALVKTSNQWHIYNIYTQELLLEGINDIKYVTEGVEKQAIILKDNQYGVISWNNLSLLPPVYDDILSLGVNGSPVYFAEKRVKEAGLYVVIYYNDEGEAIHNQTFSEEDYDFIYCY